MHVTLNTIKGAEKSLHEDIFVVHRVQVSVRRWYLVGARRELEHCPSYITYVECKIAIGSTKIWTRDRSSYDVPALYTLPIYTHSSSETTGKICTETISQWLLQMWQCKLQHNIIASYHNYRAPKSRAGWSPHQFPKFLRKFSTNPGAIGFELWPSQLAFRCSESVQCSTWAL